MIPKSALTISKVLASPEGVVAWTKTSIGFVEFVTTDQNQFFSTKALSCHHRFWGSWIDEASPNVL